MFLGTNDKCTNVKMIESYILQLWVKFFDGSLLFWSETIVKLAREESLSSFCSIQLITAANDFREAAQLFRLHIVEPIRVDLNI
jgi:hypothetical protein